MHLAKLQGGLARRYLNWDERCAARADLERAMQEIRRDRVAAAQCETASAVFWAICLAQNQAAKRPSGWVVDSAAAAAAWHMDTMHAQLIHYKGERQAGGGGPPGRGTAPARRARRGGEATGEKAGNATRVGSSGRGRGRGSVSGYSAAAAMGDASKMRSLRCRLALDAEDVYPPATWEGSGVRFWPIGFIMMDTEVASPWLCTCGANRR
ncbi:hypothetical protein EMIHUDRAFT_466115 [Emiliania huxleyi CCMP1516]|uniref:Uncharacterized protein n=2 Tax=Emiliania huxleyi TaxID=2903 RepID=A0A0D3I0M3_EMIH1|nr:hypothetical protein EMIHUDRAFT_466115 [Emiliania huxleyi CCMP1516]EOD04808.1 hypothetical protein EMIHUDRAFT_466115 [Emiliania huxleyi CCMP1516]|eukprot:XP_005757237.1 hypothetical protein EMIHUDRAFT_466115 [Emiliania huxleyi CCMP1516]